jgi:glycosyltransferase involved in cell wall biosynthesis
MTPRVAIVVSHAIQHFCPLYRSVADRGRISLRVFFGSTAGVTDYYDADFHRTIKWSAPLLDGYDSEFLAGAERARPDKPIRSSGLSARLTAFGPTVVVVYGHVHGISRQAMRWARLNHRVLAYVADSEGLSPASLWQQARRRLLLPPLYRMVDAFLTVGDANEAYYARYGAKRANFHRCPFPIDSPSLDAALGRRADNRRTIRDRFGIGEDTMVALAVGKLTGRKCPEHLVSAVRMLTGRVRLSAVFAGDGPLLEPLRQMAEREHLPIHFPGFINVDELPTFYAAADVLVHPSSRDPHPLAVSEAVYCGLPVVASDRVGNIGPTDDLRPGVNAHVYPFGDIAAFSNALLAVAPPNRRREMADASRRIGQTRSLPECTRAFEMAIHDAASARGVISGAGSVT